jgi:glyoxylate reductase
MSLGKVLITRRLPEEALAELRRCCDVTMNPSDNSWGPEGIRERLGGVDAVICVADRLDSESIRMARSARVISGYGVGYDNIDIAAATAAGIVVTNLPDEVTTATAELTMGIMLGLTRRIAEADRLIRASAPLQWGPSLLWGADLHGKTLGIIGLGRIGQAVAECARAFGMRIVYTARTPRSEPTAAQVTLPALLAESDVVSVHVPFTPETRHLIGAPELQLMKPDAFLINTARGPVIDEEALVAALTEGRLAGAGLDVFEREPLVPAALKGMANVILTPHLGTSTRETRTAMAARAAANVLSVLRGERPQRVVNPAVYVR